MIKTLNPNYPNPAKTAEIMSRYRPIAPKPETSPNSSISDGSSSFSSKIKQSPYLRNLWPQLQARPTRTRKRGRTALTLPPSSSLKRHKTTPILGYCPPCHVTSTKNLSLQSFSLQPQLPLPHGIGVLNCTMENTSTNIPGKNLVTLPLLPCSPSPSLKLDSTTTTSTSTTTSTITNVLDLNTIVSVPEEKDFLQQLQKPVSIPKTTVIAPQPIRPIGSSISVVCMSEDSTLPPLPPTPKTPHEVEQVIESEAMPAVISDSNHRIRMVNSAYKEMVGQPLCPWLETMVKDSGDAINTLRISGEVALHLSENSIPTSSNGFSCWVRIEWLSAGTTTNNKNKNCVNAFCDVVKLCCDSRDYLFTWRFHTRTREASQSSCNV